MTDVERRFCPSEFETRSAANGKVVITGYAYKFNARSQNLGGFKETILEGAGAEASKTDDIRALVNHEAHLILGRTASGTLRAAEDSTGLVYEIDADERQSYARDLLISLERKDVTHSSFGFHALDDDWNLDEDGFPLRSVRKLSLLDISPVTYPAYLASEAQVSTRALSALAGLAEKRSIFIPSSPALPVDPVLALLSLRG